MRPEPLATNLRGRLFRLAVLPALLVLSLSGVADYLSASYVSQKAADDLLLRTAHSLSIFLNPDEESESPEELARHFQSDALRYMSAGRDEVSFVVLQSNREILAGSKELIPLVRYPESRLDLPNFSDALLGGKSVRVVQFSREVGPSRYHILVCETRKEEMFTTQKIFWLTLWPNLIVMTLVAYIFSFGISKTLQPLKAMSDGIDRRLSNDYSPVPLGSSPEEVRSLLRAINRLLARLERGSVERHLFLSGAAHQLRTPLAGIQTQVELAIKESLSGPRHRLEKVLLAVKGLTHSSHQMLALARSSSTEVDSAIPEALELAEVAEELASIWLDAALAREIELQFDLAPARIQGYRWMLSEALANLLDNAIKYGPDKSVVEIRCYSDNQCFACLEVADQGDGLGSEGERLLEPFKRGASPRVEGTGLGLTIVSEIVRRHGGSLEFRKGKDGHGTVVRLVFPLAAASDDRGRNFFGTDIRG